MALKSMMWRQWRPGSAHNRENIGWLPEYAITCTSTHFGDHLRCRVKQWLLLQVLALNLKN